MNEQFTEQILDSLLEEVLTDQHPPDLTKRIEAAWQLENAAGNARPSKLVVAELVDQVVEAGEKENADNRVGQAVSSRRSNASKPHGPTRSRRTNWASFLAVAAAALLLFFAWQTLFVDSNDTHLVNNASELNGNDPGDASLDDPASSQIAGAGQTGVAPTSQAVRSSNGEVLDINDLPFANDHVVAANVPGSQNGDSEVDLTREMDAKTIIANLDRRLAGLWQQVGVQPQARLSDSELARKTSRTLLGRELAVERILLYKSDDGSLDTQGLSAALIGSGEFPQFWANNVTRQWLRRSSLPSADPKVRALSRFVSGRIASAAPWNEISIDLLGGRIGGNPGSVDTDERSEADTSSSTFAAALAGGGNHRLVKRLGTNFLNANLACIRCHNRGSDQRSTAMRQQQTYWSLVAFLYGIDAHGKGRDGTRSATDNQLELFSAQKTPRVFFDLLDGRLQVAQMQLPGGTAWKSQGNNVPREALARWIADSPMMDRATVNRTWKLIFGRHLVPQTEGIDVVAIRSRNEMLDLLATQFRTHDRDLGQLVHWIVSCDAFARLPKRLNRSEWLDATNDELEQMQVAELAFATGPSLGRSPESASLERSLAAAIDWSSSDVGNGTTEILLAQPDTRSAVFNRRQRDQPREIEMPAMSFAIHGESHTSAERTFVQRLIKSSRLSWEQRVEHVVALSEYDSANDRIQQLAKDLLRQNKGDAQAALLDLLWAVNNTNAS